MPSFEVTFKDGSREVLQADLLSEEDDRFDFLRFGAGGQERYVSRDRKIVDKIERLDGEL